MKTIKMVFFDMDGCVVDSEYTYVYAWHEVFKEYNIPIELEEILTWRGKNNLAINQTINQYTNSMEEVLNLRKIRDERFWLKMAKNEVNLKPFVHEIFDFLDSKQIPFALVTSTPKEKASRILTHFNILHRFKFMVYGDDVKESKPSPEMYLKAVNLSGFTQDECIAFEDSKNGIEACNRAQVDVIYVPDRDRINLDELAIYAEVNDFSLGINIINSLI